MDSHVDTTPSRASAVRDVLIVHPDESFSATLKCYLEERGWIAARAPDARSAVRVWEELEPQMVVVDLDVQDEDGFLLLHRVAVDAPRPPVLGLSRSAAIGPSSPDALRLLGIDQIVPGPIHLSKLADLLEALFDQRWSAPESAGGEPLENVREEARCHAA